MSTGGSGRRSSASSAARARAARSACGPPTENNDDPWLDAFVTDFLTRARERNFVVPQQAFDQALDRLRNEVVNAPEPSKDNAAALAYALYVLARNGRPVIGDLRYLSDAKLDAFPSPLGKAQLAAALAMLGDRARAGKAFGAALAALDAERDDGVSRADYGSRLRDAAAVLALVAEARLGGEIEGDAIARAGDVLDQARAQRSFTSTQENNWMALAAEALADHEAASKFSIDGQPVKGALYRRFSGASLADSSIAVANAGETPAQLVVSVSGAPVEPDPAIAHGYAIERTFYKLDGTKVDSLQSIAQNERVVVSLKVTEAQARYARLLVVDRLPAGLEIDNPALVDGGSVEAFAWLTKDVEPTHTEYRDDRFVAAFDRADGQSAFITMAYIVRAVAPGHYVYPPATAEDMYDPERYGRTGLWGDRGDGEVTWISCPRKLASRTPLQASRFAHGCTTAAAGCPLSRAGQPGAARACRDQAPLSSRPSSSPSPPLRSL